MQKEKLEIELDQATANVDKPDGEASRLKIELERMRMQLTELEASQQNLRIKNVEITAEQKMKEALYKEQVMDAIVYHFLYSLFSFRLRRKSWRERGTSITKSKRRKKN